MGDSSHKIYQYALPLTYGGSPFNTLMPCSQGCDPHGFGFNSKDKLIVVGDGTAGGSGSPHRGWLDIGRVSTNRWKKVTNRRFTAPFSSAVYALPRLDQRDPLLRNLVLIFEVRHQECLEDLVLAQDLGALCGVEVEGLALRGYLLLLLRR